MEKKLPKILEYLEKKTKTRKVFGECKTKEQFLKFYSMHDMGTRLVALSYFQSNFSLHPIGKDLRNSKMKIENEVPDYYIERIIDVKNEAEKICFCFDVKSKSSTKYFGWVNTNSVKDYLAFSEYCEVPVYIVFVLVEDNKPLEIMGYCDIVNTKPEEEFQSWDKNMVSRYKWFLGLPFLKIR